MPFLLWLILNIGAITKIWAEDISPDMDNYGKTWFYFRDNNNQLHVAQLGFNESANFISTFRADDNKPLNDSIFFELYTRQIPEEPKRINFQRRNSKFEDYSSWYRPQAVTKIIIHGWLSSPQSDTVQNIKNEYLKTKDYNIIAVDWKDIASDYIYIVPANKVREVGRYTAELIDFLIESHGTNSNNFHIIGHSLGAHVAGHAASYTKNGEKIQGLDPAMPFFEGITGPESRLDSTDAEFVDIIHSCAGILGFTEPLGHVDFYPNGGTEQPGCAKMDVICRHGRSHQYFAESINNPDYFHAYLCDSWDTFRSGKCTANPIVMGEHVPKTVNGTYYLETNDKSPFGKRQHV